MATIIIIRPVWYRPRPADRPRTNRRPPCPCCKFRPPRRPRPPWTTCTAACRPRAACLPSVPVRPRTDDRSRSMPRGPWTADLAARTIRRRPAAAIRSIRDIRVIHPEEEEVPWRRHPPYRLRRRPCNLRRRRRAATNPLPSCRPFRRRTDKQRRRRHRTRADTNRHPCMHLRRAAAAAAVILPTVNNNRHHCSDRPARILLDKKKRKNEQNDTPK